MISRSVLYKLFIDVVKDHGIKYVWYCRAFVVRDVYVFLSFIYEKNRFPLSFETFYVENNVYIRNDNFWIVFAKYPEQK